MAEGGCFITSSGCDRRFFSSEPGWFLLTVPPSTKKKLSRVFLEFQEG